MDYNYEEQTFWDKLKSHIIELIEFLAIVGAIVVVTHFFVAEPHKVSGRSMVPNFQDGDYIITNKLRIRFSDLEKGEVIIFHNPRNKDQDFIKRIIGLPTERIKILSGKVFINGEIINESYLPPNTDTEVESFMAEGEEITIPDGQYFAIGDNRGGSSDSREFGPITKDLIIGQAWLRYWPPQSIGLIKNKWSN